ncbi:flavonol 3-O-glucosyltransferase F3GT2-like [Andrographis paniculata]|uniref:flavonol 3-O-glucosyltransferase F3GT2-like n=1 Tax=Andrographis paniculata TaxID=175694 RepID=UPI0021E70027|nr:flavonol 3-O-glucosyltransferase F3GT2-like [Andrographis paniculata]
MSAAGNAHVVVFAFPFGSHAAALLDLARRMAAAAPGVRFSFFSTAATNRKVADLPSNLKVYDVDDGVPDGHVLTGNPLEAIGMFIDATPENFRRQLGEAVEDAGARITCLLTDAFLWFAADVAEELVVPWVAVWTAGPTAAALHMYTDEIHRRLGDGDRHPAGTLDFLPGMSAIRVGDLPMEILNLDTPFARLLHSMGRVLPRAAAVAVNSFDGIEPAVEDDLKSKLQKLLTVGPPPAPRRSEDQSGCLAWLDRHSAAAVVYISFGSMLTPPPEELAAVADAIEEEGIPYLWSIRESPQRQLLQEFFDRTESIGKVVGWAPQPEVLAHPSVGVFVTHCGWNSVTESIIGGVPMICRPFFGDQMINRRRVEETWQIGVGVGGGAFSRDAVVRALAIVMRSDEGTKFRENISRLQKCAFSAIEENGSTTLNFESLIRIATSPQN